MTRLRSAICLASALLLPGIATEAFASDRVTEPAGPALGLTLIADAGSVALQSPIASENLYLEVTVNGNATRKIARVVRSGDVFRVSANTLRELGFRLSPSEQRVIDVAALPGAAVRYDVAAQRLEIAAEPQLLEQHLAVLNQRDNEIPQATASPGALLNYDLYGTGGNGGGTHLSAYTELRAFSAWGVLSNTVLTRTSNSPAMGTQTGSVRMDTTLSRSFVDSALTLRVGDIVSGNLGWSRAARLGGIQLQRNFALQPDLVTFPVPAFYGQANLPSSVDLYINGMKQYSSNVPAGPFQLNTVPVVSGNGQASVVVTDALGRQRTVAFPFYTTNRLLAPGLSDYSLEFGFLREKYGQRSFSYASDPAISGTWRRGFTDWLTLEGHAEAMPGLADGGVGAVVSLGRAGVLNAAYARSQDRGDSGWLAELGYSWRNDWLNVSLGSMRTFDDYRDIGSRYSQAPAKRSDRALVGLALGQYGSLGASYVALQYPGQPRSRYGSVYYSKSLGNRMSFNVSANQNLDDRHERSVFVSLSMALDNRVTTSVSAQRNKSGSLAAVDVNRSVNSDGGFGWHLRAQQGHEKRGALAEASYRGQAAEVRAGVQSLNSSAQAYAGVSGALVLMNREFFFSRPIYDAFAVVSTDGIADIPVLLENRPIGVTNARGNLLVTRLNAYQRNKLAIDPMHLPPNVDISRVEAKAVPADRAGTLVQFGIQTVQAASVTLHDARGEPLAVGSRATLRGGSAGSAIVGYDGMVYLERLGLRNTLDVQTADGRCVVQFDYQQRGTAVPLLGPLICPVEKP